MSGFKGAVQLQKAMEIDPVTCGEFSKYVFSLTSGRANCLKGVFFYWGAQLGVATGAGAAGSTVNDPLRDGPRRQRGHT